MSKFPWIAILLGGVGAAARYIAGQGAPRAFTCAACGWHRVLRSGAACLNCGAKIEWKDGRP